MLVAATVAKHGIDGLILATLIAGVILVAVGYLRLGTYIKFIPYPVTVGFTAGIAVIIFASQIHDLLGLTLAGKEPGELIRRSQRCGRRMPRPSIPTALALAIGSVALIQALKWARPTWPGMIIAVGLAALLAAVLALPVETVGSKFGGIPRTIPLPLARYIARENPGGSA